MYIYNHPLALGVFWVKGGEEVLGHPAPDCTHPLANPPLCKSPLCKPEKHKKNVFLFTDNQR